MRKESAGKGHGFEIIELDLANLKSVRDCASHFLERGEPFDAVIANAGVMATPFGRTADAFETQFGTNHLGHFVLVNRIASLIRAGGRLISFSSAGHRFSNVDLEVPTLSEHSTSLSLRMGGPKQRTSFSQLPSTNGTATAVCARPLYIQEAFRLNWIGTWIRAMSER